MTQNGPASPSPAATPPRSGGSGASGGSGGFRGEVAYIFAFDIAYAMSRRPDGQLMGQPIVPYAVDIGKRGPRELLFYRPQMAELAPQSCRGPRGQVTVRRTVKFFPVGGLTITFRVPFDVEHLEDLVEYHEPEIDGKPLADAARALAIEVRDQIAAFLIRPNAQLRDEEAYTVFCIESPLHAAPGIAGDPQVTGASGASGASGGPIAAERWLAAHRRHVAALLTQEPDPTRLSEQEAADTAGRYLSYYDSDLLVVDWDAALLVDEPQRFSETLHIMELANIQLAELEAYDRMLDDALDRAYRDLGQSRFGRRAGVLRSLREIRIDLARLADELSNTTKFFGDWHLARIYQALSERFHLADWHRTIEDKLKTLDGLYQLLKQDQMNGWMMVLEVTIVILFVIDLVILVVVSK